MARLRITRKTGEGTPVRPGMGNGEAANGRAFHRPLTSGRRVRLMTAVELDVDPAPRPRNRPLTRAGLRQPDVQDGPQAPGIRRALRRRPLRLQTLGVAQQQHPEVAPWCQRRPADASGRRTSGTAPRRKHRVPTRRADRQTLVEGSPAIRGEGASATDIAGCRARRRRFPHRHRHERTVRLRSSPSLLARFTTGC